MDARSLLLASLQEPSAFEDRGHRLLDSRRPRCRLLGRRKVVQVTPLPTRRQRLERALEALVRMKLTSFRDKDRTHLRDMLEIGLIDSSWTSRFSAPLAARLQQLIDTPDQ